MKRILAFPVIALALFAFAVCGQAQAAGDNPKDLTRISLTIGDKVFPAVLYNTAPAKDLISRLPVTVSLNRGPVDFCGGIKPIKHGKSDAQVGYRSGDLVYWIPGQDFVIFTKDKEDSSGGPDMVVLGKVESDIEEIKKLGGTIKVTIALDR